MNSFRRINRRALLLWSLLLSLMLLCAQGNSLHVHDLAHGHDDDHAAHSQVPLNKAHSTHDASHSHDGSEVSIDSDELLKSTYNPVFAIALFVFFISLMMFTSRQFVRRRESELILHSYYLFSPPLRAPPLH